MATNTADTDIKSWVSTVTNRIKDVPKTSVMQLEQDVRQPLKQGGHMPVQRGNLRNSLEASLNGGLNADVEIDEHTLLGDPTIQIATVVSNAPIGSVISLSFRADYANEQERKHAFVRLSAQKWDQFVNNAVTGAKQRFK